MNIGYVDGKFEMLGDSTSTFWTQKWHPSEPAAGNKGYVIFDGETDSLVAAPAVGTKLHRARMGCIIYAGEP